MLTELLIALTELLIAFYGTMLTIVLTELLQTVVVLTGLMLIALVCYMVRLLVSGVADYLRN